MDINWIFSIQILTQHPFLYNTIKLKEASKIAIFSTNYILFVVYYELKHFRIILGWDCSSI